MPPGNRLNAQTRLDRGCATGSLTLVTGDTRLRVVRTRDKGRGLQAARALRKGSVVCRLNGTLVRGATPPRVGLEVFCARKPKPGAQGLWLVLAKPTLENPGNLLNTSNGRDGGNNCRFAYKPGNDYVTVRTLRAVAAGEDLLVPYGAGYTRLLRTGRDDGVSATAAPVPPLAWVHCPACDARVQRYKLGRHKGGCAAWRTRPKP
jgi:hypothetical protein